ncbi:hypothetical protein GGH96_005362 [Coemansia sp. RSA 1972]|nr:hypothetical protein GGH96_005362 [Coemansia sp. RSA 1972]
MLCMFVAGKKRNAPPLGARTAPSARARTNASFPAANNYYNREIALALNEKVCNARLYEARAHMLHKLGEYKRAMDTAKEAVIIDGNSTDGFMRIESILAATGKPKDVLDVITKDLKTANAQTFRYTQMDVHRMSIEPTVLVLGVTQ